MKVAQCPCSDSPYRSSIPIFQGKRWGGGKNSGEENLNQGHPLPKRGFGPRLVGTFSTPSGVIALSFGTGFPCKNRQLSRPEACPEIYREEAFSGTLPSPHAFCVLPPPPISWPKCLNARSWCLGYLHGSASDAVRLRGSRCWRDKILHMESLLICLQVK